MRINELIISEAKLPEVLETKEQIEKWVTKRGKRIEGTWTVDDDDLSVTVYGNVDLSNLKMTKLPVRFKKVSGRFIVRETDLTTLEGCPEEVGTWFDCSKTKIRNFIGGPKNIGASGAKYSDTFNANNCDSLESLEGLAEGTGTVTICFCKKLKAIDFLPAGIKRITAPGCGITTLKGIDKIAKRLENIQINVNPIESCILGLLKIPTLNFRSVIYETGGENTPLTQAGKIIDSVLEDGGDILDVQFALHDAGLEEMAKY